LGAARGLFLYSYKNKKKNDIIKRKQFKEEIQMITKIDPPLRMTSNEAAALYPDNYILMRMDSKSPSNDMGTVLYIGDDDDTLFAFALKLDDPNLCGVTEGLNHRRSLGGVVIGAYS
jgi:hypothetical protein